MNDRHQAPHMVSMFIGNKKTVLNLFTEELFKGFIGGHPIANTDQSNEILFSIGASSPKEVDDMAKNAIHILKDDATLLFVYPIECPLIRQYHKTIACPPLVSMRM